MASREIYWNVPHHDWLYLFAVVALAIMAYGLVRRWRLISQGSGGLGAGIGRALRGLLLDGLAGRRLWRRRSRGLAHAFILWGAIALTVGTLTVFIESDFGHADRAARAQPFIDDGVRLDTASMADDGWLLWVGCAGSFDARSQKITAAAVRVLRASGVPFAILGVDEQCCGDPARRMGNEYLFQLLAEHNIASFRTAGVKRIVTFCPHCHHVLCRDYLHFGGNFEVLHHSELFAELITSGRPQLPPQTSGESVTSIAYHDSCYLARHSSITSEPRIVLDALPALRRGELPRSRSGSFCCGGGGGHVFMEEPTGERVSHVRLAEVLAAGFSSVVTACPFCLTMLEDAAKTKDAPVAVADFAELLDDAIALDPSAVGQAASAEGEQPAELRATEGA
jgi:Fe-S oxidoreductase